MFSENLKTLRKSKGYTQEELAAKINVVRQTISKYEKGLSVPDADTLQRIAEVLEISVSQLLGADISRDENVNEVAEQLARINEQLVIRNKRWRTFWRVVGGIVLVGIVLNILAFVLFSVDTRSGSTVVTETETTKVIEPSKIE